MKTWTARAAGLILLVAASLAAGPCGDPGDEAAPTPAGGFAPTATAGLRAWDTLELQDGVRLVRSCDELPDGSTLSQGAATTSPDGSVTRWAFFYFHQASNTTYALVKYSDEDTTGCNQQVDGVVSNRAVTGLAGVDTTLRATLARDIAGIESSINYETIGCASPRYEGGPPPCWPDESPGTTVEALRITDCPSGWQRREEVQESGGYFDELFRSSAREFSLWTAFRSQDRQQVLAVFSYGPVDGAAASPPGFVLTMTPEGRIIAAGMLCGDVEAYVPAWGSREFLVTPPQTDDFDAAAKIAAVDAWIRDRGNTLIGLCGAASTVIVTDGDAWCYDYYRKGATTITARRADSDDRITLFLDQREDGSFAVSIAEPQPPPAATSTSVVGPITDWRSDPRQGVYAWSAVTGATRYRVRGKLILQRENADPCAPPFVEQTITLDVDEIIDAEDRRYAAPLPPLPEGETWYVRAEEMLSIEAIAADGKTIIAATGIAGVRDLFCGADENPDLTGGG